MEGQAMLHDPTSHEAQQSIAWDEGAARETSPHRQRHGGAVLARRVLADLCGYPLCPYRIAMDPDAGNLIDIAWVAWCAERLREQWPRADAASLEEAAASCGPMKRCVCSGP